MLILLFGAPINEFSATQWSMVKPGLLEGSLSGFLKSLWALTVYFAAILTLPLALNLVFVAVETALCGPPSSWWNISRSLVFKMAQTISIVILSVFVYRIFPTQPLLSIGSSDLQPLPALVANAILVAVALVIYDLCLWIAHFCSHKIPILWRFHSVHHSITSLDSANSYAHPVDGILQLIVIGFVAGVLKLETHSIIVFAALIFSHDHFVHTRAPIHLGSLRKWIVDNRYHHFHHSGDKENYDTNFSSYFTIWDRLAGTYRDPGNDLVATGVNGLQPPRNVYTMITAKLEKSKSDAF